MAKRDEFYSGFAKGLDESLQRGQQFRAFQASQDQQKVDNYYKWLQDKRAEEAAKRAEESQGFERERIKFAREEQLFKRRKFGPDLQKARLDVGIARQTLQKGDIDIADKLITMGREAEQYSQKQKEQQLKFKQDPFKVSDVDVLNFTNKYVDDPDATNFMQEFLNTTEPLEVPELGFRGYDNPTGLQLEGLYELRKLLNDDTLKPQQKWDNLAKKYAGNERVMKAAKAALWPQSAELTDVIMAAVLQKMGEEGTTSEEQPGFTVKQSGS